MNAAILISANAEWEATKPLFPDAPITPTPYGESIHLPPHIFNLTPDTSHLLLIHSGWGKISSAAVMQYVIDHHVPDLIVNLGTCGGFEDCVDQGDIILVKRTFVYDILELMEEDDISPFYASDLDLRWLAEPDPYPVRRGTFRLGRQRPAPREDPLLEIQRSHRRGLGVGCAGLGGAEEPGPPVDPPRSERCRP